MKKVFITGISGFIGQALTEKLSNKYKIYGLTERRTSIKGAKLFKGNLLDYERIGRILRKINPDIIIHLAARTEVEKSFYEPLEFSAINYLGTVNLIEKAAELKDLELFLFSSTMETYGYQKYWRPFTEKTAQHPNAPYAVAKLAGEKYLEYAGRAYELPYCILRQTNTYGRKDNNFFVVEQIITQMIKNPKEINLGYAEPYRNFLYIDDLINLYLTILKKIKIASYETFCTGPNNALKIKNLAKIIAEKLNWRGKINWNTKPERIGEIYYLNSKCNKAKTLLGWQPETDLDKGLDKTIKYWKEVLYDKKKKNK